jgi:hypothetical protein
MQGLCQEAFIVESEAGYRQVSGPDLNPVPPDYEVGVLTRWTATFGQSNEPANCS